MSHAIPETVLRYQLEIQQGSRRRVTQIVHDPLLPPSAPPRLETWESRREPIGKGGQGNVFLQECTSAGPKQRQCRALKVIRCQDGARQRRYMREIEIMAKFSDERLSNNAKFFVNMFGYYLSSSRKDICIAMEYCQRGDLFSYLSEHGPLSESHTQDIISQVLQGVGIMHQAGFAHRDIKPQNVLVHQCPTPESPNPWWVKLADFGISKRIDSATGTIQAGTLDYMAPELFEIFDSQTEISEIAFKAADIWAVGAMTFFTLTAGRGFKTWRRQSPDVDNCQPWPGSAISRAGLEFVLQTTGEIPSQRLGLAHAWLADRLPPKVVVWEDAGHETSPSTSSRSSFSDDEVTTLATHMADTVVSNYRTEPQAERTARASKALPDVETSRQAGKRAVSDGSESEARAPSQRLHETGRVLPDRKASSTPALTRTPYEAGGLHPGERTRSGSRSPEPTLTPFKSVQNRTPGAQEEYEEAGTITRSNSVREEQKPNRYPPIAVGGLSNMHATIDTEVDAPRRKSQETNRRTVEVEYVAPTIKTQHGAANAGQRTPKETKRRTVQVEYVAPANQTQRGAANAGQQTTAERRPLESTSPAPASHESTSASRQPGSSTVRERKLKNAAASRTSTVRRDSSSSGEYVDRPRPSKADGVGRWLMSTAAAGIIKVIAKNSSNNRPIDSSAAPSTGRRARSQSLPRQDHSRNNGTNNDLTSLTPIPLPSPAGSQRADQAYVAPSPRRPSPAPGNEASVAGMEEYMPTARATTPLVHLRDLTEDMIRGTIGREWVYRACENNDVDTLSHLIQRGVDFKTADVVTREAPLFVAARAGHSDAVSLLVESGADVQIANGNSTPLHEAAGRGDLSMVRLLLRLGADVTAMDTHGGPATHCAARGGEVDVLRYLVHHGDYGQKRDDAGFDAFDYGAREGHIEVVRYMLDRATSSDGRLNMLVTARTRNQDMAQYLEERMVAHCNRRSLLHWKLVDYHSSDSHEWKCTSLHNRSDPGSSTSTLGLSTSAYNNPYRISRGIATNGPDTISSCVFLRERQWNMAVGGRWRRRGRPDGPSVDVFRIASPSSIGAKQNPLLALHVHAPWRPGSISFTYILQSEGKGELLRELVCSWHQEQDDAGQSVFRLRQILKTGYVSSSLDLAELRLSGGWDETGAFHFEVKEEMDFQVYMAAVITALMIWVRYIEGRLTVGAIRSEAHRNWWEREQQSTG